MVNEEKKKIAENEILIGSKDFLKYVRSVQFLFEKKGMKSIVLKARGTNIIKAVSIALASKNKFVKDIKIGQITIGSETFDKEGKEIFVSSIEIILSK